MCRTVCLHDSSKDLFTSLPVAALLFTFAMFLAFAPAVALRDGVDAMGDAALAVGDGFAAVADAVNESTVSYVHTQVAMLGAVGGALAWAGNTIGDGAYLITFRPDTFHDRLSQNMRTLVMSFEPRPIHQYELARRHRFWVGNPKGANALIAAAKSPVAVTPSQ
jgi:hypothetical protein